MSKVDAATKIKNHVDRMREDKNRAEGGLAQILKLMENDFGCNSIKDAEKRIQQLHKEVSEIQKKRDKEVERLEKELPEYEQ